MAVNVRLHCVAALVFVVLTANLTIAAFGVFGPNYSDF
jgi:hypothetical protein